MDKNKENEKETERGKSPEKPVERHDTAAWADVEEVKPVSDVAIPSEEQVIEAKEYVDENEK